MSVFTYLASDFPLEEVENPHVRQMSVREALELGIQVPDFLLEPDFDKDKPDVILWVDEEKNFDEPSIRSIKREELYDEIPTDKEYIACLQWEYTPTRAQALLGYIHRHLATAPQLELAQIWLGEPCQKLKTYQISSGQLTIADLEKLLKNKGFEYPERIIVSR